MESMFRQPLILIKHFLHFGGFTYKILYWFGRHLIEIHYIKEPNITVLIQWTRRYKLQPSTGGYQWFEKKVSTVYALRVSNRPETFLITGDYLTVKKELGIAIRSSMSPCWWTLCDEVNRDPWDRSYKLVMSRAQRSGGKLSADIMNSIVDPSSRCTRWVRIRR